LGLICAGALFVRLEGLLWPKLHPDEAVIGAWFEKTPQCLYIKDRLYPNGTFTLARPFIAAYLALDRAGSWFKYFCGARDYVRDIKPYGVYFGRWLNTIAGTLLCLVAFLFVARIACSPWAGLLAAALIGFSQYAVEHSHYAETDIIALLVLSLSFLLLVIAGATSKLRWFVLAALVSGFAAGTKFTLLTLAPVVMIEAVLFARRPGRDSFWFKAIKLTCLGVFLFGIGFALANPAVLLKSDFFMAGLASEKKRVFAETMLNLGPLGAQPGVKYFHHLRELLAYIKTLGYPWIFLAAAGVPCVLIGFARRYWTILLLFPLIFAFYWVFMAPWVRSQEFLFFLPSFAALAVLPLMELWRGAASPWRSAPAESSVTLTAKAGNILFRAVVVIIALSAVVVNGRNGMRVGALFGWKDTRLMARGWLNTHMPLESRLAAEYYAQAACPAMLNAPLDIRKIEQHGISLLTEKKIDYLLRSAGMGGRGLLNPLNGRLYPDSARAWENFSAGSELLCSWAPLPPQNMTFVSPTIELYGLRHVTPQISLQLELPQPALIENNSHNQFGRQTFFPIGHKLGSASALLIDRIPQVIAVGGNEQLNRPVFLVLNTLERGAVIKVAGFGISRKVVLEPYDTVIVPLQRSKWRLCSKPFETITLQAEPVKDVLYIPCFARMAFTVNEAVRISLDTAREDRILKYFSKESLERELGLDVKYLLHSVLPAADQNEPQTFNLQNDIRQCLQAGSSAVLINGNSGYFYDQFARARLQQPYDSACLSPDAENRQIMPMETLKKLELQLPEDQVETGMAAPENIYSQALMLPILLAHGKYELRGEIMLNEKEPGNHAKVPLAIYQTQAAKTEVSNIELQPGKWQELALIVRPTREILPCLQFQAPAAAELYLRNMEIVWNLASVLDAVRNELAQASLTRGVVQDQGGSPAKSSLELKASLKNPAVFTPWLALVDFDFNPETREVKCVFEALRHDTPKLAATFWLFRRGKWRREQKQAISSKPWLDKGEREIVTVNLDQAFSKIKDAEHLGLGVETDVLWHAGAIPAQTGGYVISFSRLTGEN